jgi:hypothetical protein
LSVFWTPDPGDAEMMATATDVMKRRCSMLRALAE